MGLFGLGPLVAAGSGGAARLTATGCRDRRRPRMPRPTTRRCASASPAREFDPALLHRIAVIGSGTLDGLPHNGAVVTLLAV